MNVRIATEVERVPLPNYPHLFTAHIKQWAYLDDHLLCSVTYDQELYGSTKINGKWTTVPMEEKLALVLDDGMPLRKLINELFGMGMDNGYENWNRYRLDVPGISDGSPVGESYISFEGGPSAA